MVNRAVLLPGQLPVFGSDSSLVDLKCWLPVNELAGSRLNNMIDSLNPGVMTGGSWIGNGVSLDGTSDLITMNRIGGMTDWTLLVRYIPGTVSGQHSIFDQSDVYLAQNGSGLVYGFNDGGSDITSSVSSVLSADTPVNIAVVNSGNVYTIYVDGDQKGTFTDATTPDTSQTNAIVGRRVSPGVSYVSLTPSNLTGEKGMSGQVTYLPGSDSLNSANVTELLSSITGSIHVWVKPSWASSDTDDHYVFDFGSVKLYWDGTNTQWKATVNSVDITRTDSFSANTWIYLLLTWDSNTPTIDLTADATGASQVTSAHTVAAPGSTLYLESDSSSANTFSGPVSMRIAGIIESSLYDSGDGDTGMFVVDSGAVVFNFSDEDSGVTYWHKGCTVSAIVDNGNDATLTTPANSDNRFPVDGDAVVVSDGTGYSKSAFMDGVGSDTSVTVDDGAGAAVADIEKVGVSIDCDGQYYASGGDVLDIGANDFSCSGWVKITDEPGLYDRIMDKWENGVGGYSILFFGDSKIGIILIDGAGVPTQSFSGTALTVGIWYHWAIVFDRSGNASLYLNGVADGTPIDISAKTGSLDNGAAFQLGRWATSDATAPPANISDNKIYTNGLWSAAQILYQATHPRDVSASAGTITDNWLLDEGSGATLTGKVNDLTLSDAAAWSQEAFVSRNRLVDGDMENGGIGAWTIVGTPTTVDKETDTDSDEKSLHLVSSADDDGVSQTIIASNGDKFYLNQRHKVTAGSFEVNVTNGGGGIETGINDASWTELEKIISATGNLTFQWLGEAPADDFNISKATLMQCVAGDSLVADQYYTLVYNVDTTTTGAAETVLGSAATEVKAGDLYVAVDEAEAASSGGTEDFMNGKVEDMAIYSRALVQTDIGQWPLKKNIL